MAEKETGGRDSLQKIERVFAPKPLATFLRQIDKKRRLTREDRLRILDQALLLLEMNYVHLPLKRAMHAIDPIRRLKLLKFRLQDKESEMEDEMQFHRRLLEIFASLRDVHTHYQLPEYFEDQMAFLPFLIEQYFVPKKTRKQAARDLRKGMKSASKENGRDELVEKFMVSRIASRFYRSSANAGPEVVNFKPGVEVLFWNGVPIQKAIALNGETQAGSNLEARFARGLDSLTSRPLDMSLPPDESWVSLTYRSKTGEILTLNKQEWMVGAVGERPLATKTTRKKRAAIDIKKTKINQLKKKLYSQKTSRRANKSFHVQKAFQDIFYAQARIVDGREIGYVRLFNFDPDDPEEFVTEFRRVITAKGFPQEGLIIDVRGNPGGKIRAGQRLLQLFTPRRITPELFEFINSPLNLEICKRAPKDWQLSKWVKSIAENLETGAVYSTAFPFDSEEDCNDIGQVYYGPVIIITDALCYSTTDMFAAGFQDNKVGKVLGTSDNTGAGGANNWHYESLMEALETDPNSPFKPLPKGADLAVAMRRSIRVGHHAGRPLEELGITPDERHFMTRRDLLEGNIDLIKRAAQELKTKSIYALSVKPFRRKATRGVAITCESKIPPGETGQNLSYLNINVNGRFYQTINAKNGWIEKQKIILKGGKRKIKLLVEAFDGKNNLVAAYRYE
jgi:C-terminal processing protease CtpA/Prc